MGGSNSTRNTAVLKTLRHGDIIKVVKMEKDKNKQPMEVYKFYIYGGSMDKVYPLDETTSNHFTINKTTLAMDERAAITYWAACGDSYCYKSSEVEWIEATKGKSLSAEDYNKEVLKTLLPSDIVKIKCHNLLYIGNGIVVHLLSQKKCTGGYRRLPERHRKILETCPGANGLIALDFFLKLGTSKKAYKANRSDLHGMHYQAVIKRALSQLGPADFSLFRKNCQDFVYYVKYTFQFRTKIESFALGRDPSILSVNPETLEMEGLAENSPNLDDEDCTELEDDRYTDVSQLIEEAPASSTCCS